MEASEMRGLARSFSNANQRKCILGIINALEDIAEEEVLPEKIDGGKNERPNNSDNSDNSDNPPKSPSKD